MTIAFTAVNHTSTTTGALSVRATAPKPLRASGLRVTGPKSLGAGQSRTFRVTFKLGRTAKLGTHRVRVTLRIDGVTVTRTVTVRVTA